jgi:hypothetical protein
VELVYAFRFLWSGDDGAVFCWHHSLDEATVPLVKIPAK